MIANVIAALLQRDDDVEGTMNEVHPIFYGFLHRA
jgi:hypothetical protein